MKPILALFGALGFAISIVQGIEPFIEVTKWLAWASERWVELTRGFWSFLFSLVGIRVPAVVADGLSGFFYTVSLTLGYSRSDIGLKLKIISYLLFLQKLDLKIQEKITTASLKIVPKLIISLLVTTPIFFVFYLILLNSFVQAWTFFGSCLVLVSLEYVLPENLYSKMNGLFFGKAREHQDLNNDNQFNSAFIIMPVLILAMLVVILALNQIALEEDRLRSAYNAARCEAGIECKN